MSKEDHFRVINPLAVAAAAAWVAGTATEARADCGQYSDAPVCQNGNTDVTCTGEIYRGCQQGQTDCADGNGNYDDVCCSGWGPGVGDNIDHQYCVERDAGWGGMDACGPAPTATGRRITTEVRHGL